METRVLIFVVEDEHLLHPVLQDTLEDAGYAVSIATSAEEAMKMLNDSRPRRRWCDASTYNAGHAGFAHRAERDRFSVGGSLRS